MSFDPYGHREPTPPASQAPGSVPESTGAERHLAEAKERVTVPGIFLIIVGVLNLLFACYSGFEFIRAAVIPGDKMLADARTSTAEFGKLFPALKEPMEEQMKERTADGVKQQALIQFGIISGLTLLASLIIIIGGVRMLQLRSYGLCILASIVASVPCISLTACCCAGEAVGVWSIIVLLSPHVRMAFR